MARRSETNYIVVHCTATKPSQDIGVAEIDEWHRARGWSGGCGYHAVIRLDGSLEFGRHFDDVGAHVKGHNRESVGIALVGGLDVVGHPADTFNDAQLYTLSMVVEMLLEAYPDAKVLGHRDLSPDADGDGVVEQSEWLKDCPCFDVRGFFDEERGNW